MATVDAPDVSLERVRFGRTARKDTWWVMPLTTFVVFSASRSSLADRMSLEPSLMSPGLSLGKAKWKNPGYTAVLTKAQLETAFGTRLE